MAEIRTERKTAGTPWGWIIALVVIAVLAFGIIWWLRAGAPPVDTTGQPGVEQRVDPAQPGQQPPQPGQQPPQPNQPMP
jgi:hypothetical protein